MSELPQLKDMGQTYDRGFLGHTARPETRYIANREQLKQYTDALKTLGQEIVLTSGTFDLLHVGHARYLEKAKEYGDILVVGVDSDAKVKARKGPDRPIVPENERVQMLAYLRSVDLLTLKQADERQWGLIDDIRPDTLVVTDETYTQKTLRELGNICGRLIVLDPQATTSTSAQIRRLQIDYASQVTEPVDELLSNHGMSEEVRTEIRILLKGSTVSRRNG